MATSPLIQKQAFESYIRWNDIVSVVTDESLDAVAVEAKRLEVIEELSVGFCLSSLPLSQRIQLADELAFHIVDLAMSMTSRHLFASRLVPFLFFLLDTIEFHLRGSNYELAEHALQTTSIRDRLADAIAQYALAEIVSEDRPSQDSRNYAHAAMLYGCITLLTAGETYRTLPETVRLRSQRLLIKCNAEFSLLSQKDAVCYAWMTSGVVRIVTETEARGSARLALVQMQALFAELAFGALNVDLPRPVHVGQLQMLLLRDKLVELSAVVDSGSPRTKMSFAFFRDVLGDVHLVGSQPQPFLWYIHRGIATVGDVLLPAIRHMPTAFHVPREMIRREIEQAASMGISATDVLRSERRLSEPPAENASQLLRNLGTLDTEAGCGALHRMLSFMPAWQRIHMTVLNRQWKRLSSQAPLHIQAPDVHSMDFLCYLSEKYRHIEYQTVHRERAVCISDAPQSP